MAALERQKAKKEFEYKMSKKVAELTQVVHMLFKRNHEREVEIQLIKEFYNKELDRLHQAYQLKIDKLDLKLKSLTEKSKSEGNEENLKAKIEQALLEHENGWIKKYDAKESQYQEEKNSSNLLKDKLTKCELELSALKSLSNDSSQTFDAELASKESEVDRLKKRVNYLEKKIAEESSKSSELVMNLEKELSKERGGNQDLRSMLEEFQENETNSSKKQQQLESELKSLRKELSRRAASELAASRRSATIHTPPSHNSASAPQDVHEELESLRKLVQKYRLELSNREGNFNRMFTEKSPVHVDQRSVKPLAALPLRTPVRDKSFSLPTSQPLDMIPGSEKMKISNTVQPRTDSSLSSRRSMTLTGIRRSLPGNIPSTGGRQLLTQFSQQNFKT